MSATAITPCEGWCSVPPRTALDFELPAGRIATEPAEVRAAGRDDVALMVASRHDERVSHDRFPAIADWLVPGDLVVVNVSATRAAALPATRADGTPLRLHLSTPLPDPTGSVPTSVLASESGQDHGIMTARTEFWSVELRAPAGAGSLPWTGGRAGEVVGLPGGARAELLTPYPPGAPAPARLWAAALQLPAPLDLYLEEHGQPIRYGARPQRWPIASYQNVYASELGSAEMPSAGRAFTADLLTRLVARGVGVAPLVLHAGVSSPEDHEPPYPEWFRVPAQTAASVNAARAGGGRIIAVGTTVVRALETCADENGRVRAGAGWTDLIIGDGHPTRATDGLLTGWHEPGASHLRLLEAVAGRLLLERCYAEALAGDYLWHEFGDLLLLLP